MTRAEFASYRFEVKYLIDTKRLEMFDQHIRTFFVPDPNNGSEQGYHNYSIYFDSPAFMYYTEKHEGLLTRIKPRIRVYKATIDEKPKVFFFEFKRKHDRVITKSRVQISEELARHLLNPHGSNLDGQIKGNSILENFMYLLRRHNLSPSMCVLYSRSAYECRFSPRLRITYDRGLQCSLRTDLHNPLSSFSYVLPPNRMLIEVKFNDGIPLWLLAIVKKFQLEQVTLSKYALSMEKCFGPQGRWWERN
jgi:hypothetical protein